MAVAGPVGVSIHAPAKGATAGFGHPRSTAVKFQSTPPRRGRRHRRDVKVDGKVVSIHAPAKGATQLSRICWRYRKRFNPRPREGATDGAKSDRRPVGVSIHAPAKGATRGLPTLPRAPACFNPRPREGGDDEPTILPCPIRSVSIHAPAKGATHVVDVRSGPGASGFNPRPRVGGDCDGRRSGNRTTCFNPRPRVGGDECSKTKLTPG